MDNIYLIYGDEEFLIDKEIKNIINKFNSSMENVARYNLDESNVKEAIEDACTISMFETNKIVICEKCNFLTGENTGCRTSGGTKADPANAAVWQGSQGTGTA